MLAFKDAEINYVIHGVRTMESTQYNVEYLIDYVTYCALVTATAVNQIPDLLPKDANIISIVKLENT